MKSSGVEWIGEIPEDWAVVPSNLFFYNSTEKVNAEINRTIEQLTASQKYGVISQKEFMKLESHTPVQKQNLSDLKKVNQNDFVISLRSFEGGIEIAQESGGITPAYTVIKEKTNKTKSSFYKYLFKSNMYIQALRGTVLDTIRDGKSIKYHHFSMVPIVLPPIKEQGDIAEKLDTLCESIDNIIKETQQSIEELKRYKQSIITEAVTKGIDSNVEMKDSGIEWIGKIPVTWTLTQFGRISSINAILVKPDDFLDFQQVSPDDIEQNSGKLSKFKTVRESGVISNNYFFSKGQILYSKIRPKLNKVVIAPFDGLCSADMYPIDTKENKQFVLFLLMSYYFLHQVSFLTADRVKMPKINQNELASILIVLPNQTEQAKIVNYLEEQTNRIDKLVQDKGKVIEELEQYKKSLIYEYVTGKKQV